MIRFFIKAIIASLSLTAVFTACQKEISDDMPSTQRVQLKISVPVDQTKVVSEMDESYVRDYQVFMFDTYYQIEDYVCQSYPDFTLDCVLGKKYIVVLVNAPAMGDIMDYPTLLSRYSNLSDNNEGAFVMAGYTSLEIKSSKPDPVSVQVTRKVAKVILSSLNVAIDMPQYSSKPFKVSSVYLINVPAQMLYLDYVASNVWYNKMGYDAEDDNTLIYDDMNDFEVTAETPYTSKNTFYCYANHVLSDSFSSVWGIRNTRLVVEAKIGEEKYYYPVTLPKLEQNKVYEVKLTITRPGAEKPDCVIDKFSSTFNVYINDWVSGGTVTEEI